IETSFKFLVSVIDFCVKPHGAVYTIGVASSPILTRTFPPLIVVAIAMENSIRKRPPRGQPYKQIFGVIGAGALRLLDDRRVTDRRVVDRAVLDIVSTPVVERHKGVGRQNWFPSSCCEAHGVSDVAHLLFGWLDRPDIQLENDIVSVNAIGIYL